MKTTVQVTFLCLLGSAACDRAQDSAVDVSAVTERPAPRPDDGERHLVLTVHVSEGRVWPGELRLGVGPARVYRAGELALRVELLDREGTAFAALAVEDPLRVRAYHQNEPSVLADPVEVRSEADTFFVLPVDPRLTAVQLLGEGYHAEPIALAATIRDLCAADDSQACRAYPRR